MEGFSDIFADVHFDDANIDFGGQKEGGNPDNPPAGDTGKTEGQKSDSPTDADDQSAAAKDSEGDKGGEPGKEGGKESGKEKAPPYDQDPKWKKARAAEAALESLKEKLGILDIEELEDLARKGLDLSKALRDKDPKQLLDDAEYLERVKKHWDSEEKSKQYEGETADERTVRLEGELAKARQELADFKSGVETRDHAQSVIKNFTSEVHKVIDATADESPYSDPERQLLTLFLGVDNPANMIDIEDRTEVRKMALQGTKNFRTLVQQIKDNAINEYLESKKAHTVDTSRGADAVKKKAAENTDTLSPQSRKSGFLTPDEVFESANREFTEILLKGLEGVS